MCMYTVYVFVYSVVKSSRIAQNFADCSVIVECDSKNSSSNSSNSSSDSGNSR